MVNIFTRLLLAWFLVQGTAYAQSLNHRIEQLIQSTFPNATIAILVKDAETNQVVYQRNANKLLTPASGIKLYTAIAALYGMGPDYRFVTTLFQNASDYYLRFSGDPSLKVEALSKLLSHIKPPTSERFVRMRIDDSHFKAPFYPDGVSYDDIGWYYTAPDTAAILNDNAAAYDFIPSGRANMPVKIKAKSKQAGLTLINQIQTVSKEAETKHCRLNIEVKPNNTLRLFGCMAKSKHPKWMKLAIPHPIQRAKQAIAQIINRRGLSLAAPIQQEKTPKSAEEVARYHSARLLTLVQHMLLESDNLYANSLTKELGFFKMGEATYKQGVFAIKNIISEKAKMDMSGVKLADGILSVIFNSISAS